MSKVDLPLVLLGEVAKPIARPVNVLPGQSYRTLGVKWWGEGAYERETIDGSKTAARQLYEVHEGDLIINKIWVRHGSIGIVPASMHGCAGSGEFPTFDLDSDRVLPRWIYWYSKTREMWGKCDALSQGTSGKNRIKPEKFLTVTVPLPPLSEQRRIVAKIEQLASKIEEARGLRDNAKVEAIALEASETEECFRQVTRDGIESVPFEVVCDRITVGQVSSMRHAYCDTGIPFLRSQNVRRNRFEPDGLCYIGREFHEANSKSKVQPGHVVIVRTGFVGTACVIPDELSEANCSYLVIVHPGKGLDSHYASRFLNSLGGLERATDASVGSAQRHYNVKAMRKTLIPVPPLPEQRRIVAYLDDLQAKVDLLKTLQAQTAAELDALLPSILDRAFRGEL